MAVIKWQGKCLCGGNVLDSMIDVGEISRREISNPIVRAAANRLLSWFTNKQVMVIMAHCNKCGRDYQVTLSHMK